PKSTEHNLENISKFYFSNSFKTHPVLESEQKEWIYPCLEDKIFYLKQKLAATFSVPTPTDELRILASSTEKTFAQLNKVESSEARKTYYFYYYLILYMRSAVGNDGLT